MLYTPLKLISLLTNKEGFSAWEFVSYSLKK